jgi:hypothetical protein
VLELPEQVVINVEGRAHGSTIASCWLMSRILPPGGSGRPT